MIWNTNTGKRSPVMIESPSPSLFARFGRWLLHRRLTEYDQADLARGAVVFAPHQDDETLGCGGTIMKKMAAGAEVGMVFLADGGTSHEKLMAPAEMAALREREATAACRVLGIEPGNVVHYRYPNRHVHEHFDDAVARIAALLDQRRPEEVFVPCAEDPPADHVATRQIALAAVEEQGRPVTVYEYPIWFWEHWPWMPATVYAPRARRDYFRHSLRALATLFRDFRCGVDVEDVLAAKLLALQEHESQMKRLNGEPEWATLEDVGNGTFLGCFFQKYELFFRYRLPSEGE